MGGLILIEIEEIKESKESIITYNLTGLKNNTNYFANGILVSN